MNELELKLEIAELDLEIEELVSQRADLVEALANVPSENPMWEGPDAYGGFVFTPLRDLREELAAGDRAEKYLAATNKMLNKSFMTVMDERKLDENFIKNFNGAKSGSSFLVNFSTYVPETADGEKLPGHTVIFRGNLSPYEAREWFESYWSTPEKHDWLRQYAQRRMSHLDRMYGRLYGETAFARFAETYPNYVPRG